MTDQWLQSLQAGGIRVVDLRGLLPVHLTRRFDQRMYSKLEGLVVHQAASPLLVKDDTAIRNIASYHIGPNHISAQGCPGFCYTGAVGADGTFHLAHDLATATWSQKGSSVGLPNANRRFLAVCFLGDFPGENHAGQQAPTVYQRRTLIRLWKVCKETWGWASSAIRDHADFGKADCPGSQLDQDVDRLKLGGAIEKPSTLFPAGVAGRELVRHQQAALIDAGYRLPVYGADGRLGKETQMALDLFRASLGKRRGGWEPSLDTILLERLRWP